MINCIKKETLDMFCKGTLDFSHICEFEPPDEIWECTKCHTLIRIPMIRDFDNMEIEDELEDWA